MVAEAVCIKVRRSTMAEVAGVVVEGTMVRDVAGASGEMGTTTRGHVSRTGREEHREGRREEHLGEHQCSSKEVQELMRQGEVRAEMMVVFRLLWGR